MWRQSKKAWNKSFCADFQLLFKYTTMGRAYECKNKTVEPNNWPPRVGEKKKLNVCGGTHFSWIYAARKLDKESSFATSHFKYIFAFPQMLLINDLLASVFDQQGCLADSSECYVTSTRRFMTKINWTFESRFQNFLKANDGLHATCESAPSWKCETIKRNE